MYLDDIKINTEIDIPESVVKYRQYKLAYY